MKTYLVNTHLVNALYPLNAYTQMSSSFKCVLNVKYVKEPRHIKINAIRF